MGYFVFQGRDSSVPCLEIAANITLVQNLTLPQSGHNRRQQFEEREKNEVNWKYEVNQVQLLGLQDAGEGPHHHPSQYFIFYRFLLH